jgi:hypothetical protein
MQCNTIGNNDVAQFLLITGGIQKITLWPLFLSCFGARETEIWTPGVEYSL